MGKKRSSSSTRWLQEHRTDQFVIQAKQLKLRSRAHFKLEEIYNKTKLIKPGMKVVDLGAAPGAWSVFASRLVGKGGVVVSCDLLPMDPVQHGVLVQGDFNDPAIQQQILASCSSIDIVLSDIAPNTCGIKNADQLKFLQLAEMVFEFSNQHLSTGGIMLTKLFHGIGFDDYLRNTRANFSSTKIFKPEASRSRSTECYLLAIK